MTTLQEALELVRAKGVTKIDLKVADLFGRWQHFTLPSHRFDADLIADGSGFDGSSLRGFQQIHESDMLLMPDLDTAALDPWGSAAAATGGGLSNTWPRPRPWACR